MEDYTWYIILNYWCNLKTPLGSGLTIPFLVGVEKKFGRGAYYDTNLLLDEFCSLDNEFSLIINYCSNIGMDVCSLEELTKQEKDYYKNFGTLFLGVGEYKKLKSIEEIKEVIKNEYTTYIEENKFSINNGEWTCFTKTELKWLSDVL